MSAERLDLSDAEYVWDGPYPLVRLKVNGRAAYLLSENQKPTVHDAGLVHLGGGFADLCPPVTLHPPDGGPTTLEGFSADPRLFKLYDAFLRAAADGTFTPGPVAIPD